MNSPVSPIAFLVLAFVQTVTNVGFGQDATQGSWTLNQPGRVAELVVDQSKNVDPPVTQQESNRQMTAPAVPTATSESPAPTNEVDDFIGRFAGETSYIASQKLSGSTIQTVLLIGALGFAPAILLMTTCYIRIMVVLGLLRQALGTTQLPPTQVLMSLSIFITLLVMAPVWQEVKTNAIDPYCQAENGISWEEAWQRGAAPVKRFMLRQIQVTGNQGSIEVFFKHASGNKNAVLPSSLEQVPLNVVLPAFILSELKVAFLLGFQIFLPFLILDLVVSSLTVSMGMNMLPPAMVSLPLKIILFVMVDGWNLVVGMLLQSFGPLG